MTESTSNEPIFTKPLLRGVVQHAQVVAARVGSILPVAYRLIRRGDGNGNMIPVLQGMFTWQQGEEFGREWRDLETQDEPYVEDHIPFA
jgi:hypothetical protein